MVRQTFSPGDAISILGIPLSARLSADQFVWAYSPKGHFMVCSAYKVVLSSTSDLVPGPSNGQNSRAFWKSLWGLNVPNKIKNFAWRASCYILPTKANLCYQKDLDNPICEACGMEAKSSGHLFWQCDKAQEIWTTSGILIDSSGVRFNEFVDLLWHLKFVQHVGNEILELVITIAWSIWFNQNQVRQGKVDRSTSMIIHKARSMIKESQMAKFWPSRTSMKEVEMWINHLHVIKST